MTNKKTTAASGYKPRRRTTFKDTFRAADEGGVHDKKEVVSTSIWLPKTTYKKLRMATIQQDGVVMKQLLAITCEKGLADSKLETYLSQIPHHEVAELKNVSIVMPRKLHRQLQEYAAEHDTQVSRLVHTIIENYLPTTT